MRPIAFAVAGFISIASAAPAHAQSDFSGLTLRPGDRLYVTQPSGIEVRGSLTRLTPTLLEIDRHQFKPEAGLTIDRAGDSLLNGTWSICRLAPRRTNPHPHGQQWHRVEIQLLSRRSG